jgi:hypothetical protein
VVVCSGLSRLISIGLRLLGRVGEGGASIGFMGGVSFHIDCPGLIDGDVLGVPILGSDRARVIDSIREPGFGRDFTVSMIGVETIAFAREPPLDWAGVVVC